MRSLGILFLLVCLTSMRAGTVSSDSSATTNATDSSYKPSIYIDGQVQKPGSYAWFPGMTIVDAIQAAGGFANSTNHLVWIMRVENGHQNRVKFNADTFLYGVEKAPSLEDGDVISVPNRIL